MRIRLSELKRMIESEVKSVLRETRQPRRRSLSSFLFEEDSKKDSKEDGEGKWKPISGKTNVANADPSEVFDQLVSRDPNAPIFAAVASEGCTLKPEETASFYEKMGKQTFISRWEAMAKKIPSSGLPKSEMPVLPGPKDTKGSIDDLKDILKTGGKYNVDFESVSRRGPSLSESNVYRRWGRLAGLISEKVDPPAPDSLEPGSPEAEEYLKSGLKDGNSEDDNVTINAPGNIKAAEAVPTQQNINIGKTIAFATPTKAGGWEIKSGPIGAYGSTNNEILDGHHRWSGLMISDPSADMGTFANIDLDAIGGGDMKRGLRHLTAIGNALGNKTRT